MKAVLASAFLAGLVAVPAWAGSVAPAERERLVLGVAENAGDMPTFMALEKGFYRDEGLDVTTKSWPAGKMALEALLRGEVNVATVADLGIGPSEISACGRHHHPVRL